MKTKKAYEALERSLEKHKALIEADYDLDCLKRIKDKIFTQDLIENYGWVMSQSVKGNSYSFSITNEISAGTFGGKTNRSIAWEDDGKDPDGEFLLHIRFSTGAYFFGKEYDKDLFKCFWKELESYEPSFKDRTNRSLYFSKEKAGKVLQNYDQIVKKHRDLYKSEADKRRAAELRAELEKLEGSSKSQ